MKVTVRFEGGEELARALSTLSTRVSKRVLKEALVEAAEPMRKAIASGAPRRPPAPDIADHISISDVRATETNGAGVKIGPEKGTYYYGKFLEYGTARMSARPFMRPAFDSGAEQAIVTIGQALWRELAGKGIARVGASLSTPSGPGRNV